mgnify:CR=1 FL=1
MPTKKSAVPSEDRVREIAHKLWLDAGHPDGPAEAHWARANETPAKEGKPAAKKAAPGKKAAPAKAAAPAAAPAPAAKAAPAKKAPAKKPAKA